MTLPVGEPDITEEVDKATAFVAIELMNQWARFSRSLYLASCRGAKDAAGKRITCAVRYEDDNESLRIAANLYRTRPIPAGQVVKSKDELNWLEPLNLFRALQQVGASNATSVGGAVSLQSRSLRDLPSVRNFFGHRGADTAAKVLGPTGVINNYRVDPAEHPTEFCLSYERGKSRSVLGTWLEDIATMEEVACLW
jgi:hypothetical protein